MAFRMKKTLTSLGLRNNSTTPLHDNHTGGPVDPPKEVVVSDKDDRLVLKIVDGLGLKSFLPFARIHDFFAKRYIEKRIKRMHARISWDLSGRKGNWK